MHPLLASAAVKNKRRAAVVIMGTLAIGATGCGASGSGTPTTTRSTPPVSAVASQTPTSTPAPSVSTLPESVLAPLNGLTYTSDGVDDDALLARITGSTRANDVYSGLLMRRLKNSDGQYVGGVMLTRSLTSHSANTVDEMAKEAAAGFAKAKKAKRVRVDGQVSWQATTAADPPVTVIGWPDGDDIVLIWGATPKDATLLVRAYMKSEEG